MSRFVLVLALLAMGCQKSAAEKQREVDQCSLDYPIAQLATCLRSHHGWDSTDAFFAQMAKENAEYRP